MDISAQVEREGICLPSAFLLFSGLQGIGFCLPTVERPSALTNSNANLFWKRPQTHPETMFYLLSGQHSSSKLHIKLTITDPNVQRLAKPLLELCLLMFH